MTNSSTNDYLAVPPSGKGAGVLVLHAWWGLNDFFRKFCDRLAQQGFVAFAPDMFSGKIAHTIEEAESLVTGLNWDEDIPPKILPALEALSKHPAVTNKGLGIIGFSFGAFWALWLAQHQPEQIEAVTLYYGTNGGQGDFHNSKASYLGHFAETDPNEPAEVVKEMEKVLNEANRPATFYIYPGSGHWFAEEDRKDAYNPSAAQLAWERTVSFLHRQLDNPSGG